MKKGHEIYCNNCGKQITSDYLHVDKEWGYFSNKDLEKHSFDLCEECYDKFIRGFQQEIEKKEVTEVV